MRNIQSSVRTDEAGFSLAELLVAMVITLMISGSIFGLMTSGQSRFQREPELVDRQDNIRMAMDILEQDINGAGMSVNAYTQIFASGLDGGSNIEGPQADSYVVNGVETVVATANYYPNGHYKVTGKPDKPDALEMIVHAADCPDIYAAGVAGTKINLA